MDIKEKNLETVARRKSWFRDFLTCRRVLNIMVFLGFMVNYMLRVNLTFAIVDMVMKLPNVTDSTTVMNIAMAPNLNRSVRSIPEAEFMEAYPDVDNTPDDDDDEKTSDNRNLRKKNLVGSKTTTPNKPTVTGTVPKNVSIPGNPNFQSFSSGTGAKTQYTGGQMASSGGKTQFGSGGNFKSGSSFQSAGGSFQSAGGNFQSFSGNTGSGSSFQSSGGGFQQKSAAGQSSIGAGGSEVVQKKSISGLNGQFQGIAGESEVVQKKSVSGLNGQFQGTAGESEVQKKSISGLNSQFQATAGGESETMQKNSLSELDSQIEDGSSSDTMQPKQPAQNNQLASDDSGPVVGTGSANSKDTLPKDNISDNISDNTNTDAKVGLALNTLDDAGTERTNTNDGSSNIDHSIIGEEKTDNQRILFTKDSNKQLPQVGDSKLADEVVGGNNESSTLPPGLVAVNDTRELDVFGVVVEVRDRIRRFNWSESQQGILIGSFFWGYICTELPGGRLAEIIGARRVFGYATLGASVVTLLTPLSAKIHFLFVVFIRIALGLFLGPTWPSILPLASKWIPPDERGKFLSNMMGSTLGAGFTLPLCGLIIAHFSWEYVFYITGLLGFIWSVMWFILVFETPADHPRISPEERWYIETKLGVRSSKDSNAYSNEEKQASRGLIVANQAVDDSCLSDNEQKNDDCNRNYSTFTHTNGNANGASDAKTETSNDKKSSLESTTDSETESSLKKVPHAIETNLVLAPNGKVAQPEAQNQSSHANAPWLHILTSVPVWAFVLTHGASVFGYNTITNQLPTYMKYILHYNIKQNGVLSALPYIGKYVAALVGGSIADKLLHSPRFSKTFVRKLFTSIGVMIPGFLMILQIFVGDHKVVSIFVFTVALTANGCVTGGYLGNSLDIAPNYSGTVFGLGNMFSGLSGAVSAIIVGYLTDNNQVYGQWQKVFLIVAITYLVGSMIFLIFGSTEVQWWNSSKAQKKKTEIDHDLNEETVILQAGRRRSSVSSVLRSYTEDELGAQSAHSSGKDHAQNHRKKRRRKKLVSEENESFESSKHKRNSKSENTSSKTSPQLVRTKLPDSDTVSSDYKDETKSKDATETKIKLRKKRPEKYHEDYSLNVKKRISYKHAIENGSHSDSYDSENKTQLKTPTDEKHNTDVEKIKTDSSLDDSEKVRLKKNSHSDPDISPNSSDLETNDEHKKSRKTREQREYSDDDSMSENSSHRKSKRHRSKLTKPKIKGESENGQIKKKIRKKIAFIIDSPTDTPEDRDKSESTDKAAKKSTKLLKKDSHPSTSIVSNQNESTDSDDENAPNKDKSDKTSKKKLRQKLPKLSASFIHSLSSPLS